MRQFRLRLAQRPLRLLALRQIEHEGDALVSASAEGRRAEKDGHAGAVFPKVLLRKSLAASGRSEFCHGPFVSTAPFIGRQRRPAHATRDKIVAAVSHHVKKGFVRLGNATFKIPDEYPDDVGIDEASDLRL